MEERTIDNEREIKIKRKREGDDVVDALAQDTDTPEQEDVVLELPESEYDEDLVGLTPTQLKDELARREKAKEISEAAQKKLLLSGEERLAAQDYAEAEIFFSQALVYGESQEASEKLWRARTKNFTDTEGFYTEANAAQFAAEGEEVRALVLEKIGEKLQAEREAYRKEEAPLQEKVLAAIAERRAPFFANKRYYQLRLRICFAALGICLLWAIVSVSMIYSTEGMLPVWLAIAAGVCALVCLGLTVFFWRKHFLARRLYEENERLSSTEDGARLEYLANRLALLDVIFGEETQE